MEIEKGEQGGECARKECHGHNALFYNSSTRMWYCAKCAKQINFYAEQELCVLKPLSEEK